MPEVEAEAVAVAGGAMARVAGVGVEGAEVTARGTAKMARSSL